MEKTCDNSAQLVGIHLASFLVSGVKAKAISKASYSVLVGRKEQSFSFDAKMFLRNQESMPAEVAEDL